MPSWLKAIMAPMEIQIREHQIQLKRRLESIKRIHQATDTLEDRIEELVHVENGLVSQKQALTEIGTGVGDVLRAGGKHRGSAQRGVSSMRRRPQPMPYPSPSAQNVAEQLRDALFGVGREAVDDL
jgi:hypothetical protein